MVVYSLLPLLVITNNFMFMLLSEDTLLSVLRRYVGKELLGYTVNLCSTF